MADTTLYASCRVGNLLIGIDAQAVQEVTVGATLTPVPLASPLVSAVRVTSAGISPA